MYQLKNNVGPIHNTITFVDNMPYSKFKAYMVEKNITNIDLSNIIKKSIITIDGIINGTGEDFTMNDILIICNKFNINPEIFIKRE